MARPLTTLDRWRRKAFALTHELAQLESQHEKECRQFHSAEDKIMQKIRDTERSVAATEKQNAQLSKEQKVADSRIGVLRRRLAECDSRHCEAVGQYERLIDVGRAHLSFEPPRVQISLRPKGIQRLTRKLQSVAIPPPPKPATDLELEVREWKRKLAERTREAEERRAAIAIYQKLIGATRRYHQLNVQMQGIEAELQREEAERLREKQLRDKLEQLKEDGKRQLNEQERQLREAYEGKRMERDRLLAQKKSIQVEIENCRSGFENRREACADEVRQAEAALTKQKVEIEELRERLEELEAAVCIDRGVMTERSEATDLPKPRRPPAPLPQQAGSRLPTDARAKLADLWKAAQATAMTHAPR